MASGRNVVFLRKNGFDQAITNVKYNSNQGKQLFPIFIFKIVRMKSAVFISLFVLSTPVLAQRIYLDSARTYLSEGNYKKALPFAEGAVRNEKTKDDPEAWFLRGMAHLQLAQEASANAPGAATDAYSSFLKTLALKPDYGREINNPMHSVAIIKFNKAAELFAAKSYDRAYSEFTEVYAIYKIGDGKRFSDNKEFKGMAYEARKNAVSSASSAGRNEDAIGLLEDMIKGDYKNDTEVYQSLIDICDAEKNDVGEVAAINAARSRFPKNENFRTAELNYYINSGKNETLLPKLEDAVKKDPGNADLVFRLANVYAAMAFPADEQGKLLPQPANFTDLFSEAEHAYSKALEMAPGDAARNFNFGILYYDYSRWYNLKMTEKPGADDKLISEMTAKENEELSKGLPYFEKSFAVLDVKASTLLGAEKTMYHNTMNVLRGIYTENGDTAKLAQIDAALGKWK